jgi:predicted ABC-type transport system involved in lysophospholipase L1 biosynthesis ATPase subunit
MDHHPLATFRRLQQRVAIARSLINQPKVLMDGRAADQVSRLATSEEISSNVHRIERVEASRLSLSLTISSVASHAQRIFRYSRRA